MQNISGAPQLCLQQSPCPRSCQAPFTLPSSICADQEWHRMHSASRPHPSHLPARSRVTLRHHHQPCGDSDRGKGSTCGINPWICPPASAFLRFPSQHCCFIHGMAPPGFFQCPLPTWGQTQPSKSQACCRQQSPAPAPQHPSSMAPVGSFHGKTHRILLSLAPDRDAGR